MRERFPSMFGVLAVLLVACFVLLTPTPAMADSAIDVGRAAVEMPAMLSSPSSVDFALSPTSNGEILEPTLPTWVNVIGVVVTIILGLCVIIGLAAAILSPFVPALNYLTDKLIRKFRDLSGDFDQEEVTTLHRVHRPDQPLRHIEVKPAS